MGTRFSVLALALALAPSYAFSQVTLPAGSTPKTFPDQRNTATGDQDRDRHDAQVEEQQENSVTITQGPTVSNVTGNSATITWTTNKKAANEVRYAHDGRHWQTAYSPGGSRDHAVTLTGLEPGKNYTFRIMTREQEIRTTGQFQTLGGTGGATTAVSAGTNIQTSRVPLYRLVSSSGDHLLTTSEGERNSVSARGYRLEGMAGYIFSTPEPGLEPFYRLASNSGNGHFYTASASERDRAAGFHSEGITGYIASTQLPGTTPLYRLSNSANSDHFYTTSPQERQQAMQAGYRDEGIVGYIWTSQQ